MAVRTACQELLSSPVGRLKKLSGSIDAAVYRVQLQDSYSAIVKIRYGSVQWRAEKEARFFAAVGKSDLLNTATVLGCGPLKNCDASALITSALEGQRLSDAIEIGLYSPSVGRHLIGTLLAKFHDIRIPPLIVQAQYRRERLGNPASALITLTAKQDETLRERSFSDLADRVAPCFRRIVELGQLDCDWVWCHGDLHPSNVIVCARDGRERTLHVVDFESTMQCVPEYDIAKSIVTSSALRQSDATDIIRGFGAHRIISEELIYMLVVFHAVDGWLYAAQLERRDCQLWRERLNYALASYASRF